MNGEIVTDRSISVYITSAQRDFGTNEQFTYRLGDFPIHCYGFSLTEAEVPNSFYNVETLDNTFTLNEGGLDLLVTVTPGHYSTGASFAAAIKAALDSASTLPQVYTVTYSSITNTLTISAGAPFSLIFNDDYIGLMMGFLETGTFGPSMSLTSPNAVFLFAGHLFIESQILTNTSNSGFNVCGRSGERDKGCLIVQKIPLDYSSGYDPLHPIIFTNPDYFVRKLLNPLIDRIDLKITYGPDSRRKSDVNLRNISWSCSILLYKSPKSPELS